MIFSPAELQFWPNLVGSSLQLLTWVFFMPGEGFSPLAANPGLPLLLLCNGVSFYAQMLSSTVLISYVTPVTYR